MARSVVHVAHEPRVGSGQLEDPPRDLEVLELVAGADVVDLARLALPQDELDRRAVVATWSQSRVWRPSP